MTQATFTMLLTFIEAFATVEVAGLGGVMLHEHSVYVWPEMPALALISAGAVLAGIRRLQSLLAAAPS